MSQNIPSPRLSLRFLRHGATSANQARLRCGGDLDLPLTDLGREQAFEAARQIAMLDDPIGLIFTSNLQRTRETAAIIAATLPGVPVVIEPDFAERRLGRWNLKPIGETQALLEARCTPPGGESDAEFTERIAKGLRRIKAHLPERPLLVGSKGVARVMGELVSWPYRLQLGNGEITEFEFASRPCLETSWSAL
jgi:2,3-bisphosphoglycerate-dependent phosphoglycerate mutase